MPRVRGVSQQGAAMTRYLFASLLCGLAFAAGAQNATLEPVASAPSDASATTASAPAGEQRDLRAESDRPLSDRNCLRETGSLIVASQNARADRRKDPSERRCAPVHGRSYDREDLDRTGQTNIADALRMLDPSVN
jgi:hypothetical protein